MKKSNQTEQRWFCCPIHFTGVNCRRKDFRTVPFIYAIYLLYSRLSILPETVYTKCKYSVDEIADASRDFPWDF